ncbi:MAG TPA: signal transduction protein [Oxalobacteraceae bacterium]|jgi:CBS domain-containing protein|nr:signal transduction protein [Oxalobacteraceae bacterium]
MTERTVLQSISKRTVITVSAQATAFEAAGIMTKARCGSVLIVDAAGALLGIFTERDLMTKVVAKALAPDRTPVSEVMTPSPQVVAPETSVSDAVLLMKECGFRHLPILSPDAKIVGVFSLRDATPREIIDADTVAEHLDREFTNIPL